MIFHCKLCISIFHINAIYNVYIFAVSTPYIQNPHYVNYGSIQINQSLHLVLFPTNSYQAMWAKAVNQFMSHIRGCVGIAFDLVWLGRPVGWLTRVHSHGRWLLLCQG